MLAKWWWRFKTEKKGLWRRIVWAIHHNSRAWSDVPAKISVPGPWKNIVNIRSNMENVNVDLTHAVSTKVANGLTTEFWLDNWAGSGPLYKIFPNLFKLEIEKESGF
ncbi:hypothetical protein Hanom_Chr04g00298721 [Helianthus anomalus]